MNNAPSTANFQPENPQTCDSTRPNSGKAKRESDLPLMAHKIIPAEFEQGRDADDIARDWNTYPRIVDRIVARSNARRLTHLEDRQRMAGLVVMRRAA